MKNYTWKFQVDIKSLLNWLMRKTCGCNWKSLSMDLSKLQSSYGNSWLKYWISWVFCKLLMMHIFLCTMVDDVKEIFCMYVDNISCVGSKICTQKAIKNVINKISSETNGGTNFIVLIYLWCTFEYILLTSFDKAIVVAILDSTLLCCEPIAHFTIVGSFSWTIQLHLFNISSDK